MLYCKNCGKPVKRKDKVCPSCGCNLRKPVEEPISGYYKVSNAVVFATLSIVTAFLPGPGVVFGIIGINLGKRDFSKKVVKASIIGLVLSLVSLGIWLYLALK
ncbi:MAG: hypothetical protein H6687_03310 [Bacillales bacterium]|nr:hypothetical protein [Bacillales bacterium]